MATSLIINIQGIAFDIIEATVDSIHEEIQQGKLTSTQLLDLYIKRIRALNFDLSRGAPINAIVHLNISSYEDARNLDSYYEEHHALMGPLHGIPIFLKDNMDSYNPLYNAGGSSGGSAAAVNANFATLALGTDNSGSIRIPAAFNGLYGLRPSSGRVSSKGIFPRGNLDGVAGPIARNIKDLALLFGIITGDKSPDFSFLQTDALQGKKIAIVDKVSDKNPFQGTPTEIAHLYDELYSQLKLKGATIAHIDLPDFQSDRTENMSGEIEEINEYLQAFCSTLIPVPDS